MTGARALARLALRDARRDRWRTLLVVLMVTIPVAGLVGVAALIDATTATAEERAVGRLGIADAEASPGWWNTADALEGEAALVDLQSRVAPGTRIEQIRQTDDRVLADGRRVLVQLTDQRLDADSLAAGQVDVVAGALPASSDEAVISSRLAAVLEVAVGDRIHLETSGEVEVSGLAERREWLSSREVFLTGDAFPADEGGSFGSFLLRSADVPDDPGHLVTGDNVAIDNAWPDDGDPAWFVTTREEILSQRYTGGERFALVVIGGLAGVEVALIAGAAFAVSVRRRQRELGLLAAVGGSQRHVRRTVLMTGAVAALAGSLAGTALAVGGMFVASPWLDAFAGRVTGGPTFDPAWIALSVGIGVTSVIAGAWRPARSVARLPVTVALSGRRPTPVPSRRGLAGGAVLLAAGVVVLFVGTAMRGPYIFLLGCVLVVLGAGWTSPWLLEKLGGLAPRLPVGLRLAVRDAARYRTRNGPIVTAAMAGLAGTITVAAMIGSMNAEAAEHRNGTMSDRHILVEGEQEGADLVANHLADDLDARHLPMQQADAEVVDPVTRTHYSAVWGTPDLARELGGEPAVAALEAGHVVVFGTDDVSAVSVGFFEPGDGQPGPGQTIPATSVPGAGPGGGPWLLLDHALMPQGLRPATASDQGSRHLLVLDQSVGRSESATAREAADRLAPGAAWVQTRYVDDGERLVTAIVISVGVLFGLALVAVAIALAAAESRGDLRILGAVGASRRTRRSLAVGRALLLSGLGGLLAVPVGLLPAYVVATHGPTSGPLPFHLPWLTIAIVAIGVPTVAALGAALASRRSTSQLTRAA